MVAQRRQIASALLLSVLVCTGHASKEDSTSKQIQMLNSQIQSQLQQIQELQQKQNQALNVQVQGQLKQMQANLQAQIQTLSKQTQAQIAAMQTGLQEQIKQVYQVATQQKKP